MFTDSIIFKQNIYCSFLRIGEGSRSSLQVRFCIFLKQVFSLTKLLNSCSSRKDSMQHHLEISQCQNFFAVALSAKAFIKIVKIIFIMLRQRMIRSAKQPLVIKTQFCKKAFNIVWQLFFFFFFFFLIFNIQRVCFSNIYYYTNIVTLTSIQVHVTSVHIVWQLRFY